MQNLSKIIRCLHSQAIFGHSFRYVNDAIEIDKTLFLFDC